MVRLEKILLLANLVLYGFITAFSYSYVDLNLTISQNTFVLAFVNSMQQIGYFHRPKASLLYLLIIILTFSFFLLNLWLFSKSKIGVKYLTISTLANTFILIFAYPFLSSDLFNYLFDAKIIVNYHVSPYTHRPLDFPQDEWLRFMRWIHRYSPYGPLWLIFSIIPSILGFGKFILTFIAFKIFIGSFHLINSLLIYKILKKVNAKKALVGTAFYAINPFFLIEGIVNGHNDLVFATFLLLPIYFSQEKGKMLMAFLANLLGTLIKYISVLILPLLIAKFFLGMPKSFRAMVILNLIVMISFTFIYSLIKITVPFVSSGSTQVQFQPWYLFWTLPLIALIPETMLILGAVIVSFGAAMRYLPFLYYGDWSQPGTIQFMQLSIVLSALIAFCLNIFNIKKR